MRPSWGLSARSFFVNLLVSSLVVASESSVSRAAPFNIDHIGFESTIKAYDNLGWHVIHRERSEQWNGWYVTEGWSDGAHYERYIATTNHWFEDARFQNWYPTLTASAER